jgi:carbon starvation protein
VTTVAAWQKVFSADPKLGFFAAASDMAGKLAAGTLPPDKAAVASQLIFNQRLDGWLAAVFTIILWFVILDMGRVCVRRLRGQPVGATSEAPYQPTRLEGAIPVTTGLAPVGH